MPSFPPDHTLCSHPADRLRITRDPDTARTHALCTLCRTEFHSHEPDNPHPAPLPQHVRNAMQAAVPGLVTGDEFDLFLARAEGRTLEVGARFSTRATPWEPGCEWTMHADPPFLRLRMAVDLGEQVRHVLRHRPAAVMDYPDGQIHQFNHSTVDFALLTGRHALTMTARFAGTPRAYGLGDWYQEAYYQAAIAARAGDAVLPGTEDLPEGAHTMVLLLLMDTVTDLIAGLRPVSMPAALFNKLRATIAAQGAEAHHIPLGNAEIVGWQRRYPSQELLFADAPLTWRGGTDRPAPR